MELNYVADLNVAELNHVAVLNHVAELDQIAVLNHVAELDQIAVLNHVAELNDVAVLKHVAEQNQTAEPDVCGMQPYRRCIYCYTPLYAYL